MGNVVKHLNSYYGNPGSKVISIATMDTMPSRVHLNDLLPLGKYNLLKFLKSPKTVPPARDSSGKLPCCCGQISHIKQGTS